MTDRTNDLNDVVIVGAGFAGLCMLHRIRALKLSVKLFERAPDVGGTWYWNRYPGARCDVESLDYQFAFSDSLQRGWRWKERFAEQAEILDYLRYVTKTLNLAGDIQFNTTVTKAAYLERECVWEITTNSEMIVYAKRLITAVGCLSSPTMPNIKGLSDFKGSVLHTADWPTENFNLSGLNVGVIGTGSSGVQLIPEIAKKAKNLFVFQRSPNFSVPANNHYYPQSFIDEYHDTFLDKRKRAAKTNFGNITWSSYPSALGISEQKRNEIYERNWQKGGAGFMVSFADVLTNQHSNDTAAQFIRNKIGEVVNDKRVAQALMPTDHAVGTKRMCVDQNYFQTFNKKHVTLVDLRKSPIEEINATGISTSQRHFELDLLICATGFDAITGTLLRIDIRGRNGLKLSKKWEHGPKNFLGLATAGFPNLFIITGPGSPSVLSNMVLSIEQHVDWIGNCINEISQRGANKIEATEAAEQKWTAHVNNVAETTLFPKNDSWYTGSNIRGKPRVFMPYVGGIGEYKRYCDLVAARDYAGFEIQ